MKSLVPSLSVFCVLIPVALGAQERKTPKKPEQPFRVYVFTEGLQNEDVDMPAVTEEVRKRIGKKKSWLHVVAARDDADIVVEVMTHAVDEQRRTRFNQRVNNSGIGKTMIEETFVSERHHIECRIDFPNGAQQLITGIDDRERGGTMKGAAANLADKLEDYCKDHYWDLVGSD